MENLSLVELKKLAKVQRIKQYYIKKRSELIELLSMNELPASYRIEKMTIAELRSLAKDRGLRGFWALSKNDLTTLLFPPHNKKQDNSQTSEHEDPQDQNSNDVGVHAVEGSSE
jgi:hypothetical protein